MKWMFAVAAIFFAGGLNSGAFAAAESANGASTPALAPTPDARAAADALARQYHLGAGDKLQLTTFGEPSLSGTFQISGAGMVDIPLIGEIAAKGLTTVEFGRAVELALQNGFLKNPNVSVEVLNYRPFYILGEVNKPGEYPYTSGLTVLNAVATANGFTYRANTHHLFIKRADEQAEHDVELKADTLVQPGDTIRVKERYF